MRLSLFIDDIRDPPSSDWITVRSSEDAIRWLKSARCPDEISFDHDLGGDDTSIVFINAFTDMVLDGHIHVPEGFRYYVHSANPVGSENIRSKMDALLRHLGLL